jgi:myo-inositol 2-dehydrogenase/D-chiro-inositol 1-dehydrogenase
MSKRYRIGVIGFGGMGRYWSREIAASSRWELVAVCDQSAAALELARHQHPTARATTDAETLLADASLDVIGIYTQADHRPALMLRALAAGKHLLVEKPLGADVPTEEHVLAAVEASGRQVAVNLFNRNAWYHKEALAFIAAGEIGELAVVRVRHQTPGILPFSHRAPVAALAPEGAPFHDCGMHYVDVARWYAGGEYVPGQWHVQGAAFWGVPHPWWLNAHGVFSNGVVFDITQGSCYGHLAKDRDQSCGLEAIGTLGVVRYHHDFTTVKMECLGVNQTLRKQGPYGDKKIDVMVDVFARSLDVGKNLGYPTARDAVIASRVSAAMVEQAYRSLPMKGTAADLQRIKQRNNPQ